MTQLRTIEPGEKGIDVSYHYPSGAAIRAKGYTFALGYVSPNPLKNLPKAVAEDWIDNGLGVWPIWEVNAGWTNGGESRGRIDGMLARQQSEALGCPHEVPPIAANDTNTDATSLPTHLGYAQGYAVTVTPYPLGSYCDLDLGRALAYAQLLWLPNAYRWSIPSPLPKSVAVQRARDIGYHMIQGRLTDDTNEPSYDVIDGINVDINHCIKRCIAWGNPKVEEQPMTPYIFKLADGSLGIRHESGSRSINDGEMSGPFKGETVYDVPAGSNWEAWIRDELAKYTTDLDPPQPQPVDVRVTIPPLHVDTHTTGTVSP